MTKKHYVRIAKILHDAIRTNATLKEVAVTLCDYLIEENPRFDEERFMNAVMNGV